MRIEGAWTAIVTPFNSDGTVDWGGLGRNLDFQMREGITGVVPVGTTGESPTLSWDEHKDVVYATLSRCKGNGCEVLAGTGSNSTEEALASTEHAVASGAQGVLLVDCYYNGPSSQELRDEYYGVVAAAFPDTIIVPYVIPGRSGTALAVEDLALLNAKYPNVNTVKEATGDLDRMARTRELLGSASSIMSGDDDITLKMMIDPAIRANGVISVASNVAPGWISMMVRLAANGDVAGAQKAMEAVAPLLSIVTVKIDNPRLLPKGQRVLVNDRYRNPVAIKTLMNGLGMPAGPCKRPLGKMSRAGVEAVRAAAAMVWAKHPEVLKPIEGCYDVDLGKRLSDDSIWEALARSEE